jgi:Undecaprenyl-phosphate glucose phosphotransferase
MEMTQMRRATQAVRLTDAEQATLDHHPAAALLLRSLRAKRSTSVRERHAFLATIGICMDGAAVLLSAIIAYSYRYRTVDLPFDHLLLAALGSVGLVNVVSLAGGYRLGEDRPWRPHFRVALASWLGVFLSLIALAYFCKISADVSRIWMSVWFASGAVLLVAARSVAAAVAFRWRHEGKLVPRVILLGSGGRITKLAERLHRKAEPVVDLVATFDDAPRSRAEACDDIVALARANVVDEILVATPSLDEPYLEELLGRLRAYAVNVRLFLDFFEPLASAGRIESFCGLPMVSVIEKPIIGANRLIKRVEDVALSSVAIVATLPLMALIAIAIKLESAGPALFCQTRFGFNNNPICVYKFRTMVVDAGRDAAAPQATRGDARVTRIGRILRRTSLDELPQLFNVLLGDMALVGPRPHPVALNVRFAARVDDYLARHRVKPGITGWAQVNGLRGETETEEKMRARVAYDLEYINNWTLLFDLRILARTVFVGFLHKNAY